MREQICARDLRQVIAPEVVVRRDDRVGEQRKSAKVNDPDAIQNPPGPTNGDGGKVALSESVKEKRTGGGRTG